MMLSEEEIAILLEPLYEDYEYSPSSVWEHKDGGKYEIIKLVPFVLNEDIGDSLSISRNLHLVWYRLNFSDKLNDEVYVRTKEHFEKSFKYITDSN